LSYNDLKILDGQLFARNFEIISMKFNFNQINAVGRSFFERFTSLSIVEMTNNLCVDDSWSIGSGTTIQTIINELETCFENSGDSPTGKLRRFLLELRGPLTLKFENGTKVVEV
jgi:hypothetical protein